MSVSDESSMLAAVLNFSNAVRLIGSGDLVLAGVRLGFANRDVYNIDDADIRERGVVLYRSILELATCRAYSTGPWG